MGFQDDVNDLKSVSFDLLYSQVSSLVASYNELDFSGEKSEAFKNRLSLLQDTIGSLKNLIKNVEDFGNFNNNYTPSDDFDNDSNKDDLADFISNTKPSATNDSDKDQINKDLNFNDFTKDDKISDTTFADSNSNANLAGNNSLVFGTNSGDSNSSTVNVVPVDDNLNNMVNDVSSTVAASEDNDYPTKDVSENNTSLAINDDDSTDNNVNVRAITVLPKFYKNSDKPTKAIVVNDNQYSKLLSSGSEQASLIDFGVSDFNSNVSIESMIEKANDLYNRGEKEAAEKLYEQINNMMLVEKST